MRSGRVTPDTLVCEDGADEWRLARKVPGLVPPKALKAWQASVAAAAKVEAAPPPPPVRPAMRPVAARSAEPAPPREPAQSSPSPVRRHALLALVVAVAAAGGGIIGAVLVLRRLPAPAVLPATPVPGVADTTATTPAAPASAHPDAARPILKRPEPPEALPQQALDLLTARVSALEPLRAAQRASSEAFLRDGGIDASTVQTREALASRMAALDELRDRNESLRRALSDVPEQVRADAAKAGLAPEVADAAARRARRELTAELRARDADAEMHDVAAEVLGLLDDGFGTWTVADRAIAFAPGAGDDAARRYAELLADAKAIAAR